jgi:hypothetical protein
MTRADAVAWVRDHVATPSTERGLFAIALARLSSIGTFLGADRHSYGDLFVRTDGAERSPVDERFFQLWLASELRHRSAHQYSVVREEEDAQRKKPDLRLYAADLLPTSIELKVLERWTEDQLVAALESQLVGQYMHTVNSRFGVLVLCSIAGQTKDGVDAQRMVVRLKDLARKLVAGGTVHGLEVILLRFAIAPTAVPWARKQTRARRT